MPEFLRLDVDDTALRAAIDEANPPALLAALVHLGGPAVLRDELRPEGGHLREPDGGFSTEQLRSLRDLAYSVIASYRGEGHDLPPAPDEAMLARTMDFCTGEHIPAEYVPMMLSEMQLTDTDAYAIEWHHKPPAEVLDQFMVLVIGAGMSGMCAAIRLEEAGIPYVVVEKNPRVGGTWLENTYPGCRVDVQNHFYSYSFEPNHDWPEYYSRRDDLQRYFERCADKYGVRRHIRFDTEVVSARYDEDAAAWRVRLRPSAGTEYELEANVVISGVGQLNRPKIPGLLGLETFEGPAFHSARWEHDHDFTGKRVAVVGTGASAMQFSPELAETVERLLIFQRSPNWANYSAEYAKRVSDEKKWLLKQLPYYAKWYRFILFWRTSDGAYPALQVDPDWPHPERSLNATNDMMRQMITDYIRSEIGDDPDLLAKVVPTYPPFGKRILIDNGWFRMVKRPNVDLITDEIREITRNEIVVESGARFEVDAIVFATGFHSHHFLWPMEIVGRCGTSLREVWGENPRAYLGVTVPDFPNLFCLYGPNTNLGHGGSIIFHTECQVRYVVRCLRELLERGKSSIEVRREVHDEYNDRVDSMHANMVWAHAGMSSWYKNAHGRVTTNSPWRLVDYWKMTDEPDLADYHVR
jgi:4-hydroxyacetophenone monooxygenase